MFYMSMLYCISILAGLAMGFCAGYLYRKYIENKKDGI